MTETRALDDAHDLPAADTPASATGLRAPTGTDETTTVLLREAVARLHEAERIMAAQEQRIRELEAEVSTDALTGLMNRRGFESFFQQELARVRRGTSAGAVLVMIDLDGFKDINDTHGHQAGDACLKHVAEQIMHSIRFTDGAARFGGDEFAILLTQTDPQKVYASVRTLRAALNAFAFTWEGRELACGGSLGSAAVMPDDDGFSTAYLKADAALYADKSARKRAAALAR